MSVKTRPKYSARTRAVALMRPCTACSSPKYTACVCLSGNRWAIPGEPLKHPHLERLRATA